MVVEQEINPPDGEDSYAYVMEEDHCLIAVFDGCGGIGSYKYSSADNHTGAYLSSRLAAQATLDWYDHVYNPALPHLAAAQLTEELSEVLCNTKTELATISSSVSISGSMVKTLPSTIALAVVDREDESSLRAQFIWAGDSRGFMLDAQGLHQCTNDHLMSKLDPMQNIEKDSALSNMIQADHHFFLEHTFVTVQQPCVFLVASDGAFSYFLSPMEFEFALLDSLQKSKTMNQWRQLLTDILAGIAGDDFSLVMALFGYTTFNDLKRALNKRHSMLLEQCIKPIDASSSSDMSLRFRLWEDYQHTYMYYQSGDRQ